MPSAKAAIDAAFETEVLPWTMLRAWSCQGGRVGAACTADQGIDLDLGEEVRPHTPCVVHFDFFVEIQIG